MLGQVDAVLLARDDAEHHFEMAKPFIEAGIPIFIDKPLALSFDIVNTMFSLQKYPSQIYSCSALRYAEELQLTRQDIEKTGAIVHVEASVMKKWETYSVHLIEPIVAQLPKRGNLINVEVINTNPIYQVSITWEHCTAYIKVTGSIPSPITFTYFGEKGSVTKLFANSFDCFKTSLESFVNQIRTKEISINRKETLEIIEIIEKGIYG
jgi:hypothetical protein